MIFEKPNNSNFIQTTGARLALSLLSMLMLSIAWTGFVSSDDGYYVQSGLAWINEFPYVPQHFGNVRWAVSVPIALLIYFFGESELSVVASTCLFYLMTVALTSELLKREVGNKPAFVTAAALTTVPLFALKATIPGADIPELLFVASSFWTFWHACSKPKPITLALSGIMAGIAFSAHELTAALLLFYCILFIIEFKIPRRMYLWMLFGFFIIIALEATYYWVTAGNPAHRLFLLMQATTVHDRVQVGLFQIAAGGTLHIWEPLDPIVMLFTHHDAGLVGWVSLPAVYWVLWTRRNDQSRSIVLARLLLGLALAWLIVSAVLLRNMILLPRYYMVTIYCLLIVTGIWGASVLSHKRIVLTSILLAVVFVTNILCVLVDNKNPRFAERALVDYLVTSEGTVNTDPLTAHNAYWFCRWKNVDCGRILTTPPAAGVAYFWNPQNTATPNRFLTREMLSSYQPRSTWVKSTSLVEQPNALAKLIADIGLIPVIPTQVSAKLVRQNKVEVFVTLN